jgi:hypothetical protein
MDLCQSSKAFGNEHAWEFVEIRHGEEWERCAHCGEFRFVRYHDIGSGG